MVPRQAKGGLRLEPAAARSTKIRTGPTGLPAGLKLASSSLHPAVYRSESGQVPYLMFRVGSLSRPGAHAAEKTSCECEDLQVNWPDLRLGQGRRAAAGSMRRPFNVSRAPGLV